MKQPDHDYAAVLEPEWDDLTVCYTETDLWIPVRVSNVSGRAWQTNGTSPTRLSYHWYDASGALWVRDGVRTPLGLEFAPGTSRDARIRVVVPEKPGPATLAITLVHEGVAWFEKHGFVPPRRTFELLNFAQVAAGSIRVEVAPDEVLVGARVPIAIRVSNASRYLWMAEGDAATQVRWVWKRVDTPEHVGRFEGSRPFTAEVQPGDWCLSRFELNAPMQPGRYDLQVGLTFPGIGHASFCSRFETANLTIDAVDHLSLTKKERRAREARATSDARRVDETVYATWFERHHAPSTALLAEVRRENETNEGLPRVTILIDAQGEHDVEGAITSLRAQTHEAWEALAITRPSTDVPTERLLAHLAREEPRLRVFASDADEHLAATLNRAIASASGELVWLLDARDRLSPIALQVVAGECARDPSVAWIWTDGDAIDEHGRHLEPYLLPPVDPDLHATLPDRSTRSVYRASTLLEAGGFRPGFDGAERFDLALRLAERLRPDEILHVPHVLHHRRMDEPTTRPQAPSKRAANEAARRAIGEHFARRGEDVAVARLHAYEGFRVTHALPGNRPRVSVIVPSRDNLVMLRRCVAGLLERTSYHPLEIVIVDNGSEDPATLDYLASLEESGTALIVRRPGPFNWSELNNEGVAASSGEMLCLLNDDVEPLDANWLEEMVRHALREDVGVVGARLWYPDNRLQHGGVRMGPSGIAGHIGHALHRYETEVRQLQLVHTLSAVTGACMVMRADVFRAAGAMDAERLPIPYNDVEFCLRVTERLGARVVWTPHAELFHICSASRGKPETLDERLLAIRSIGYLQVCWQAKIFRDPFLNPNLDWTPEQRIAHPPKVNLGEALRRVSRSRRRPVGFVHIPKTAGTALRLAIQRQLPSRTLVLGGRDLLRCYDAEPKTTAEIRREARECDVWFSHIRRGFGALIGVPCDYATILRRPVDRVWSQYEHLSGGLASPLFGTRFEGAPLATFLRTGMIPGNLMLHAILGGRPEPATAGEVLGGKRAFGGRFAGFGFPREVWSEQEEGLLAGPGVAPETDLGLVDEAMRILDEEFVFVGLQESLGAQLGPLAGALGLEPFELPFVNQRSPTRRTSPSDDDRATIAAYNALDQALYDRIAALPGGYHERRRTQG